MVALVTATIHPQVEVSNQLSMDVIERERQYLQTVRFLLASKEVDGIVICENTNFAFEKWDFLKQIAFEKEKKIEFISFVGDETMVKKQGKGYGEGEIMEYAFKNSKLLHNADTFMKITGRLTVKNLDKLLFNINSGNIYMKTLAVNLKSQLADTRFYIMPVKLYKSYFIDLYKDVFDQDGAIIEKIFYDFILSKKMKIVDFPVFPQIEGYSGATGRLYNESMIKYKMKDILLKLGYYRIWKRENNEK